MKKYATNARYVLKKYANLDKLLNNIIDKGCDEDGRKRNCIEIRWSVRTGKRSFQWLITSEPEVRNNSKASRSCSVKAESLIEFAEWWFITAI